ncbi:MAG: FKBP-type peptidyl-prolyl cis-trans isomerase [Ferruginibacter sp.]
MKHFFYLLAVTSLLFASCTKPFKKTEGGLEYKIISDGKGKTLQNGNFFEIQFDQVYSGAGKDTILFDSRTVSNQIVTMDSAAIPPVYFKIFNQSRKGDSIVVKQLTDSIMKGGNTPPFMKKGAYIIAHYKIVSIFLTKEAADSAYQTQMVLAKSKDSVKAIEQLKKDDKIIAEYLAKNNIQAVKAPQGTYVEILAPGEGEAVDTSKVLKVFYTGKTLDGGKVFDSNRDTAFGHTEVFPVYMGAIPGTQGSVIKGWTDGLSLLKKGGKAKLYIPSPLAYGSQGAGGEIKPNANLLFEVEVVDVVNVAQAQADAEVLRKKMEAEQKKAMESAQKAPAKK